MAKPGQITADTLHFRAAGPDDIFALQALYAQLIPDEEPTGDDMQATLRRILADPDDGEIVVCETGGLIVATCQLIVYDNLVRTPYKKAMIDSVVVDADHRHRGIGSAMMAWSIEELQRRGCSKIIVATAFSRQAAHAMYSKLGFDRFGLSFVMSCKDATGQNSIGQTSTHKDDTSLAPPRRQKAGATAGH